MLTIYYMEFLEDQDHAAAVQVILADFFALDNGSDDDWKANLEQLRVLETLGEDKLFDKLMDDLQDDERYKNFIINLTSS